MTSPRGASEAVEEWAYGVSHVERGEVIETETCFDRETAERTVVSCGPDETGRSCFLVRRPAQVHWQPVEDAKAEQGVCAGCGGTGRLRDEHGIAAAHANGLLILDPHEYSDPCHLCQPDLDEPPC